MHRRIVLTAREHDGLVGEICDSIELKTSVQLTDKDYEVISEHVLSLIQSLNEAESED